MYEIQKLFDLSGKIAVVTGGGDGMGKDVARFLPLPELR